MTGNRELAARARELAGQQPADRAAWLCAAVALAETASVAAARKVLGGWDGPPAIKAGAIDLLSTITTRERTP